MTTEPPGTVPPATDDDDGGFVPWLLLALALVAVVGAGVTAFVILSRRSSARVLPAVAPIVAGTPSVFISYSRDDTDRIDLLKAALKRANLEPWVDTTAIAGGQRWKDEIVDGIESSRVIVLAISATSVRSEHVAAELDLGKQEGKRVLPVHLEPNVELSRHFRYDLSRIQHIEMFDDRDETIAVVVDAVRRLIDD